MTGNVKAVCTWIGNSPAVAMEHYAQVTDADLQEAAKMSLINDAENQVQNPVQTTAETSCKEPHESNAIDELNLGDCESNSGNATPCEKVRNKTNWAWLDSNQRPAHYECAALTD